MYVGDPWGDEYSGNENEELVNSLFNEVKNLIERYEEIEELISTFYFEKQVLQGKKNQGDISIHTSSNRVVTFDECIRSKAIDAICDVYSTKIDELEKELKDIRMNFTEIMSGKNNN